MSNQEKDGVDMTVVNNAAEQETTAAMPAATAETTAPPAVQGTDIVDDAGVVGKTARDAEESVVKDSLSVANNQGTCPSASLDPTVVSLPASASEVHFEVTEPYPTKEAAGENEALETVINEEMSRIQSKEEEGVNNDTKPVEEGEKKIKADEEPHKENEPMAKSFCNEQTEAAQTAPPPGEVQTVVVDEEAEVEFNVEEYMECRELNIQNNRRRSRRRRADEVDGEAEEEAGAEEEEQQQEEQQQEEEEEVQYFVGPYCAYEGGEIFLGLFTDDTCTTTASDGLFKTLMGFDLPYEKTSLVSATCVSCLEPQENNNGGDDADDADQVSEGCENIYLSSGKCESTLPEGMVASPNTAACTYMQGITIVRKDGIIDVGVGRKSPVATSFIVIFAMAFCAMAFYVWYLRTRLGVKKDTLL